MKRRKNESGNVLFLILIAVVLFAALSYAVTSSSRGGSGNVNDETWDLVASEVLQHFTSIRTTILRMRVSSALSPSEISFSTFNTGTNGVFSPNGGKAINMQPPKQVREYWDSKGSPANRYGYAGLEHPTYGIYLDGVGTNDDVTGRDMFGGLPDIPLGLCEAFNRRLGLSIPPATSSATSNTSTASYSVGNNVIDAYPGAGAGCFHSDGGAGVYVFYITLIEQ